jgi:hypothetical protein
MERPVMLVLNSLDVGPGECLARLFGPVEVTQQCGQGPVLDSVESLGPSLPQVDPELGRQIDREVPEARGAVENPSELDGLVVLGVVAVAADSRVPRGDLAERSSLYAHPPLGHGGESPFTLDLGGLGNARILTPLVELCAATLW